MEIALIVFVALAGSFLSFFSGFGLGTLLLPAFTLFMPLPIAVAATAVVHMLNNIFKLFLVGKFADRKLVICFGGLSIIGAFIGAWALGQIADGGQLFSWTFKTRVYEVSWMKFVIALLVLVFAIYEALPMKEARPVSRGWMPVGGLLSGFFGGISGHQGALRSAFLMKAGLTKEAFMGTRVVCACLVDSTRISVYASDIGNGWAGVDMVLVGFATLAAFLGAYLGNKYMKKSSNKFIGQFVTWSLVVFAIALGAGLI